MDNNFKKIISDSAAFANFCQAFKMKWWEKDTASYGEINYISECDLDELAMIAWEIMNK